MDYPNEKSPQNEGLIYVKNSILLFQKLKHMTF